MQRSTRNHKYPRMFYGVFTCRVAKDAEHYEQCFKEEIQALIVGAGLALALVTGLVLYIG